MKETTGTENNDCKIITFFGLNVVIHVAAVKFRFAASCQIVLKNLAFNLDHGKIRSHARRESSALSKTEDAWPVLFMTIENKDVL